jgi:hypothetical protein
MKTLYKKQMRKAFSRGLRGKTNNVPGFYGYVFHSIGKDIAKGVELDYVKVEDTATWSKLALRLRYVWTSLHKFSVIHSGKCYTLDLRVFFHDYDSVKDRIK